MISLKQYYKQLISQQLDEVKQYKGITPIAGNPAPYGFKKVGKRYVPVTREEHEERVKKQNTNWDQVNIQQQELHAREGITALRPTPWGG